MYERTLYIRRKCGLIDKGDEVGVRTSKHERAMQDDDRQAGRQQGKDETSAGVRSRAG